MLHFSVEEVKVKQESWILKSEILKSTEMASIRLKVKYNRTE